MTLTNFPNGISTSTISATTIDFPASGTVDAGVGNIDTITATLVTTDTVAPTIANVGTLTLGTTTPLTGLYVENITLTPATVAANSAAEQTFALANVGTADIILSVNKPTVQTGLVLGGARVSAAGSIGINFGNLTGAAITPTAGQVYSVAFLKHG